MPLRHPAQSFPDPPPDAPLITEQHDPTEACFWVHCHVHNVDEWVFKPYIVCGECFHVYETARDLRQAYRRSLWEIATHRYPQGRQLPSLRMLTGMLTVRARRIFFCQHCIHDF